MRKKKKRENQQGLLFTGPEGYIAHLGTHSEVTGRELYYFCSFSVNLKLFKISLGKNALQKMLKEVIEKIWCLVRNCFLVQSQLSSHFVSIWWEKHGTTLILFYKRTSPLRGSPHALHNHHTKVPPPNTVRFQHMNLERHKYSVYSKMV